QRRRRAGGCLPHLLHPGEALYQAVRRLPAAAGGGEEQGAMPRVTAADRRIDTDALFVPLTRFGRLGLAVSGGPDSLALMLLAHRFAAGSDRHDRFVVYTVDHGLRPEAAAETAFV